MKKEIQEFKTKYKICPDCKGDGWYQDHGNHNPETGECLGCPIQVECSFCEADGFIEIGKERTQIINDLTPNDIPF